MAFHATAETSPPSPSGDPWAGLVLFHWNGVCEPLYVHGRRLYLLSPVIWLWPLPDSCFGPVLTFTCF